MSKDLLTIDDLCQKLGIGRNSAYKLINSKEIKSTKIGKRHIIRRQDLNQYISQKIKADNS